MPKPKRLGKSAKSFERRVDFPEPEGPDIIMGARGFILEDSAGGWEEEGSAVEMVGVSKEVRRADRVSREEYR